MAMYIRRFKRLNYINMHASLMPVGENCKYIMYDCYDKLLLRFMLRIITIAV